MQWYNPVVATPETVTFVKNYFFHRLGFDEENLKLVDPYTWGGHYQRLLLWIARGHLRIVDPSDTSEQRRRIISYEFMVDSKRAMSPLEIGNRSLSFDRLKKMGLEVVSDPKPDSFSSPD